MIVLEISNSIICYVVKVENLKKYDDSKSRISVVLDPGINSSKKWVMWPVTYNLWVMENDSYYRFFGC